MTLIETAAAATTCEACIDDEHGLCADPFETHTTYSQIDPPEVFVLVCCCDAPTSGRSTDAHVPCLPDDPF